MTALEVYNALRDCTGREDLARLGVSIFLHERGPSGYEAGYGYTDSGPLPQWRGRQVEGVCSELKRFFGTTRPLTPSTLEEFWRKEWRATDVDWWRKVWTWYDRVRTLPQEAMGSIPLGRQAPPTSALPRYSVEDKLRGSLSPEVQERMRELQGGLSREARRYLLIALGIIGLAVVWREVRR